MPSDSKNYSDLISRRRFVELTGVSGAAALAGCDGDGDGTATEEPAGGDTDTPDDSGGDTDTPDDGGDTEVQDKTFVAMTNNPPNEQHINQINTQNYDWIGSWNLTERLVAWNFVTEEFESAGLESYDISEDAITLNIREDFNWENGDPVTADDLRVGWQLRVNAERNVADFTENVNVVDDKTLEIELPEPTHPRLVGYELEGFRVFAKESEFADYLDQDPEEIQTYSDYQGPDTVISNSAWSLTGVTSQDWQMERNDEYYNADNINWSNYDVVQYDSNTAQQQALMSGGDVDSAPSLFCPPEVVAQLPDGVEEINLPAKWGYGIVFNHDHEHFGERAVRQAAAYVIDRQTVVDNAGPLTKFPTSHPCGIAPRDIETWIGDDLENFNSYGVDESDTESATALLEDAGYSQVDGVWENEDGSAISEDYITPAGWTDFTVATNTVVDQLNSFGFDLSTSSAPTNDMFGQYTESNFALGAHHWLPGEARSSFPYFPLRWQATNGNISNGHNYPGDEEVTVPAMDGDGEMNIVPADRIAEVAQTTSDEEAEPIIREVAYANNQDLPFLSLMSKWEQSWVMTQRGWSVSDAEEDRQVKWPPIWMPKQGTLQAE